MRERRKGSEKERREVRRREVEGSEREGQRGRGEFFLCLIVSVNVNVNGLHLFSVFSNHWPLKALYNIASHSPFTHTFTHRRRSQPCKGDSQLVGSS